MLFTVDTHACSSQTLKLDTPYISQNIISDKATKKENPFLRARPTQIFFVAEFFFFFKFFPKPCKNQPFFDQDMKILAEIY